MLDTMDIAHVVEHAAKWEEVLRKLRSGMMPPSGSPRPSAQVIDAFASGLEAELDRTATGKAAAADSTGLHRMNRTEYRNAIRDLLSLEIDVASLLPADDGMYGFDNISNSLGLSSAVVEGFLSAASKVSRMAVGDAKTAPALINYPVPGDLSQDEHIEGLPLGTRGGMLIRHNFPADGEYKFQIALVRGGGKELFGNTARGEKLEMSIDGKPVKVFDLDQEEKHHVIIDNVVQPYEVQAPVLAGLHVVGFAFAKRNYAPTEDSFSSTYLRSSISALDVSRSGVPHLYSVAIGGPYAITGISETPSRRQIFSCHPKNESEETPCAEKIVSTLARRAYRRPVNSTDMEVLMAFYRRGRADGFEPGIEMALRRILASLEFTFRVEQEPAGLKPGASYRISDLELASRLSFFLWSSIPDDELVRLAAKKRLRDPVVLEAQVRRMLADPRSSELVSNFAGQWLNLRNLAGASPSPAEFPSFDDNLRIALRRETEMLFSSLIQEDRSIVDLLAADYTFVNERLARHYGIPNVYGSQFRRVSLANSPRKGLLGHGSILTATSLPTRTSPVARGKWVLENILGTPPPMPPANVPSLTETASSSGGKEFSLRQRMEEHRKNPSCAGCHRVMDPIGFSLENFDATGRWRIKDGSNTIDASGQLVNGTKIDGPESLRQALLSHPEQFAQTVTEKLLTYALGRGVQYYDRPTVRAIARYASRSNYRFSSIVMGIVKSTPFQMQTMSAAKETNAVAARN
jgi:hypothetical protein